MYRTLEPIVTQGCEHEAKIKLDVGSVCPGEAKAAVTLSAASTLLGTHTYGLPGRTEPSDAGIRRSSR